MNIFVHMYRGIVFFLLFVGISQIKSNPTTFWFGLSSLVSLSYCETCPIHRHSLLEMFNYVQLNVVSICCELITFVLSKLIFIPALPNCFSNSVSIFLKFYFSLAFGTTSLSVDPKCESHLSLMLTHMSQSSLIS